jgi:hypothetical protein
MRPDPNITETAALERTDALIAAALRAQMNERLRAEPVPDWHPEVAQLMRGVAEMIWLQTADASVHDGKRSADQLATVVMTADGMDSVAQAGRAAGRLLLEVQDQFDALGSEQEGSRQERRHRDMNGTGAQIGDVVFLFRLKNASTWDAEQG